MPIFWRGAAWRRHTQNTNCPLHKFTFYLFLNIDALFRTVLSETRNCPKRGFNIIIIVVLVNIIFPAINVQRPLIMTVILSVCAWITQPTGVTLIIANKSTIAYISFIMSSLTAKFPTKKISNIMCRLLLVLLLGKFLTKWLK